MILESERNNLILDELSAVFEIDRNMFGNSSCQN